jgi:hypothetical protein
MGTAFWVFTHPIYTLPFWCQEGSFHAGELEKMPRKKSGNSVHVEAEVFPDMQINDAEKRAFSENPEAVSPSPKNVKSRFSIQLKEDGSVDYEGMRSDTANRFREILRDPRTIQILGTQNVELVSDQDIDMLYNMIAMIEAYAFTFAGKVDFDIARKHAAWTDQEKEMVRTPTKNVINKNAAALSAALRWKDEVILTMLLVTISRAKYEGARKEQHVRNEQKREENPATQAAEAVQ